MCGATEARPHGPGPTQADVNGIRGQSDLTQLYLCRASFAACIVQAAPGALWAERDLTGDLDLGLGRQQTDGGPPNARTDGREPNAGRGPGQQKHP